MNKRIFFILLILGLVLVFGIGSASGREGIAPSEVGLEITEAAVASKISYQGYLQENGSPVTGSRDMLYLISETDSCAVGLQEIPMPGVQVSEGYFTSILEVTASHFNGKALWLGVKINESLIACQEILPAPYALSLKPGASVVGNVSGDGLSVENQSTAVGASALYGEASGESGSTYGLHALSHSSNGTGVYGYGKGNAGGKFVSYVGNLIEGWEEVTAGGETIQRFKVDVSGNLYAASINTWTASSAEMLPAHTGLETGDVLVVGPDGQLAQSTEMNAINVVGVFNNQASIVGGKPQDNQSDFAERVIQKNNQANKLEGVYHADGLAPLSISGIVLVKASAENGPIQPGDLLTTASLAGHAMKASPIDVNGVSIFAPGTILGKALEELNTGTGLMKVLITLQ